MLAKCLLEGANIAGAGLANPGRYSHDEGMYIIAMESAQELVELYEASDYALDELEFAHYTATQESASEEVMEGIGQKIKNAAGTAVNKIRDFLDKLKKKVMEFVNNIKRFLDGIFKSGADFATKYEKELMALDLTGYKVTMYDFASMDKDYDALSKTVMKSTGTAFDNLVREAEAMAANVDKGGNYYNDQDDEETAEWKQIADDLLKKMVPSGMKTDEISTDEVRKAALAAMLGGQYATNSQPNTKDVTIDIKTIISTLKGSKNLISNLEKTRKDLESGYNKSIKALDNCATKLEKFNTSKRISSMRYASSTISKAQSITNATITAIKEATSMRTTAYKKVCTGAFAYARKHKKETKK